MNAAQLAALLSLAAMWGASFLFIRIAAPVLGPFPLMEARVLIAAASLWLFAAARRSRTEIASYWKQLLLLGLVHAAVPFALIAMAEVHISASTAAMLIASQPLFVALFSGAWLNEAITGRRAAGLLLGMCGVAIMVGWNPATPDRTNAFAIAGVLMAAICYALGSIYAKKRLSHAPAMTSALGQQLGAAVWLAVPAGLSLPHARVTLGALAALLMLALVCTAMAYLLFFWLIAQVGAVKTSTVTYIIPVFGVLWGTAFLREAVTGGMVTGLACILISLALVNRVPAPSTVPATNAARGKRHLAG
jgi:drug/metabolite transporter (DMT)-like permease